MHRCASAWCMQDGVGVIDKGDVRDAITAVAVWRPVDRVSCAVRGGDGSACQGTSSTETEQSAAGECAAPCTRHARQGLYSLLISFCHYF